MRKISQPSVSNILIDLKLQSRSGLITVHWLYRVAVRTITTECVKPVPTMPGQAVYDSFELGASYESIKHQDDISSSSTRAEVSPV